MTIINIIMGRVLRKLKFSTFDVGCQHNVKEYIGNGLIIIMKFVQRKKKINNSGESFAETLLCEY